MTDQEIVDNFWARTKHSLNRPDTWHLPDGRLNAEKCFKFVLEATKTMTPEEFAAMNRLAQIPPWES